MRAGSVADRITVGGPFWNRTRDPSLSRTGNTPLKFNKQIDLYNQYLNGAENTNLKILRK